MPPKRSARGGAKAKAFKTAPKPGRNRRAQLKAERAALAADDGEAHGQSFDERAAVSGPRGAKADKRRRKAKVRGATTDRFQHLQSEVYAVLRAGMGEDQ